MSKLNLIATIVSWDDVDSGNNPALKFVDWHRSVLDIDTEGPQTRGYKIPPGQSLAAFDGTRALTLDDTTALSVGLVLNASDRYRFRWTGGTNPGFRTDRGLDLTGQTVSISINQDATVVFNASSDLSAVLAGDVLWIPGLDENVSSPFHEGNQGFWEVLAVQDANNLVLTRNGEFSAYASDVSLSVSAANQVQAFSAAGAQAGDTLVVTAGFAPTTQRTYAVVSATSTYLEVVSSVAIAGQTGIFPRAAGFRLFSDAKRYLRVESDQEVAATLSGEATARTIVPWTPGDRSRPGWLEVCGPVYALSIANKSSQTANIVVISGE